MSNTKLAKTYQKKTDREHILDAPDTYIGSIELDDVVNWTFNPETEKIEHKKYSLIPGLYKCFDEGVVNMRDHKVRMDEKIKKGDNDCLPVKNIDIGIDKGTGTITLINDGNGIDIVKHPEYDIWIPEMIFGHLRTSTNYNKDEKKVTGGKNGFGFKLVLIWSTWGRIEVVDHTRGLKYIQEFKNNLTEICKPKITKCKGKPYVKVSFTPDYSRFGIPDGLTDDMYNLMVKRVYDISAVTDKSVKVKLNSAIIPTKTFEQYVDLYVGKKTETKRIYEESNERWEYAVCLSPLDEFTQVSFVNGIYTSKGGKHVDYVLNQILRQLVDYIEKKKKVRVKPATIKEQLMLFVNCVVENPSFDSQTKDYLTTASSKFGSSCKVSDKFIEKIAKLGVMEQALSLNDVKQNKEAKKSDGKKTRTVRGIPKLIDANNAGTAKSMDCTLILCEGDSAKAGIVSGLSREDRNYFGVFPLKGKLLNVRDESITKISNNSEITDLKKIMGLETNKKYKNAEDVKKSLRYGKILFMTDQDLDGTHIKGLGINLFDSQWSELIEIDSFLGFMNTPILKAKKGSKELCFYNDKEYDDWKKENSTKGWSIKYYKGLGTSTAKEFKEYFAKKKIVEFKFDGKPSKDSLDMVFSKTRSDDRKDWLEKYDKDASLDTSNPEVTYQDFVNRELIHFSKYDCERSIPNLVDGLKTSLRKILYSAFKRNLVNEIKVAQFGGYVSEHSGYHHGEMSLMKAIVGMAQEFVGSNNINLLLPNGQFGTRLQGGSDSASERYIFTLLNKITKKLYPQQDNYVLNYLDDDGTPVEPEFYVPIIPMILVNGSKGIGTGYSTDIMCYNPVDIIQYIRAKLETPSEKPVVEVHPYYEGFEGEIIKISDTKYMFKGKYEVVKDDVLRVTELPVGTWTDNYKQFLEKMLDEGTTPSKSKKNTSEKEGKKKKTKKSLIKDYKDMSTDTKVDIQITFQPGILKKLMSKQNDDFSTMLEKEMNLYSTKTNTNMHMFDENQQLHKYNDVYEIMDKYMIVRIEYYGKRKKFMLEQLQREVTLLTNKARFIEMQCNDELDLRRKKRAAVVELLNSHKFDTIDGDEEFKYLRTMPIDSVIEENITKLLKERDDKMKEYEILEAKTLQEIWLSELDELELEYKKYIEERKMRQEGSEPEKKKKLLKKKKLSKKVKLSN
jgi:DNA topoisomerase-2